MWNRVWQHAVFAADLDVSFHFSLLSELGQLAVLANTNPFRKTCMEQFRIPLPHFAGFQRSIDRLNKKAAKLGAPPIVITDHGIVDEPQRNGGVLRCRLISVDGDAPVLNGWHFVASLSHKKTGNIVHVLPKETLPERFRATEAVCDHCQKNRKRHDTYVVRFGDSYDFKQVGRSCLKDFVGHANPTDVAEWYVDAYATARLAAQNAGGPVEPFLYSLEFFLAIVVREIKAHGWISAAKGDDLNPSTASRALVTMEHLSVGDQPTVEEIETAVAARTWAKNLTQNTTNDYLHNLATLAGCDAIEPRELGLAASMIFAYQRDLAPPAVPGSNAHFGKVGERDVFELRLDSVRASQGQFGTTWIHSFFDSDNNAAVWFSTGKRLDLGKTYKLRCTVKDHGEFRGRAQTVLSRCVEV